MIQGLDRDELADILIWYEDLSQSVSYRKLAIRDLKGL